MTALPSTSFRMLPIGSITESPHNPRKHMDEGALADLTESVKAKGVLEPILVRPYAQGTKFEVAAGARRFRAAKAAGLTEVPAIVRDMTDAELLEVALIENVMRTDISALDEGDAYRRLQKEHGYTIERIVEKTGKSRTVVFQRMKVASLHGRARSMVETGEMSVSVAELVARLPTEKTQLEAIELLQSKKHWGFDLATVPFREAKHILDEELRLTLKKAPFDVKDAELVEGAGACAACPKRTGADKDSFRDVKDDTCLDLTCWNLKKTTATKALQAELKAQGKVVAKEKALFQPGYATSKVAGHLSEKYALRTDEVKVGDKLKKWNALFGEDLPMVTVLDEMNTPHELVDVKRATELLRERNPKAEVGGKPVEDWREQQRKADLEREAHTLVALSVRTSALEATKKVDAALALLILSWAADSYTWENMLERAGLPKKTRPEKLTPEQMVKLIVAEAFTSRRADFIEAAAKDLKVDVKKLKKQAATHPAGSCFVCAGPTLPEEKVCAPCAGEDE